MIPYTMLIKAGLAIAVVGSLAAAATVHYFKESDAFDKLNIALANSEAKYTAVIDAVKINNEKFKNEKITQEKNDDEKTYAVASAYANALDSLRINTKHPNARRKAGIAETGLPKIPYSSKRPYDQSSFTLSSPLQSQTIKLDCEKTTLQLIYLQDWIVKIAQ